MRGKLVDIPLLEENTQVAGQHFHRSTVLLIDFKFVQITFISWTYIVRERTQTSIVDGSLSKLLMLLLLCTKINFKMTLTSTIEKE